MTLNLLFYWFIFLAFWSWMFFFITDLVAATKPKQTSDSLWGQWEAQVWCLHHHFPGPLVSPPHSEGCTKCEVFIGRRRDEEVINQRKESIIWGPGHVCFAWREVFLPCRSPLLWAWRGPLWQMTSLVLDQKIPEWFRWCFCKRLKLQLDPV